MLKEYPDQVLARRATVNTKKKIDPMKKIAVIGFGFMGLTHTLNILRNKDLELAAIVDRNPGLIEKSIGEKGGNIATGIIDVSLLKDISKYSTIRECLDNENIDALCICVPTAFHYETALEALLAGKHVFIEKPLCLDINQARKLIDLAKEKSRILMTGHVVRFMPPYQKLKKWIDSGEFGDLRFLSLSRFSGHPAWGQWKDREVADNSGGALFDLVIHDIDFAAYLLGSPDNIESTCLPGYISRYDYISAIWSYNEKNAKVSIEGGNTYHASFPFQAGYMANFEKASILYTTMKGDLIQISDDDTLNETEAGDAVEGYYNEIACFSKCIENNIQPEECSPESSLESVELCYKHIKI